MMAATRPVRPLRVLLRNLLLSALLAVVLYVLFSEFGVSYFQAHGFARPIFLALEAGAVLLVAYAVAESLTSATSTILERRGIASRSHAARLFLNILVAVAAVLVLFSLAGVSPESIFLGSAFAGIILGLAAQTVLSNVFAGLLIVLADPYRPGDRVAFITSSYGALAPSYPHEMMYPGYSGTIRDVGLVYTVIELDSGGLAKFPNSIAITALSLHQVPGVARAFRVRMTFPQTVPVPLVEATVAEIAPTLPGASPSRPPPGVEVTDISMTTWDAVVTVWSTVVDEGPVRDRVLRAVLAKLSTPRPS
ncbi:MAG TPA: mechanosensitive ion channel family protein [Thermoplasmata archaeon]|jgi:small-conductance mechanosensitive channel|nr:mechanosensitive ion channel family protein [Thermoplasmata archaeon]